MIFLRSLSEWVFLGQLDINISFDGPTSQITPKVTELKEDTEADIPPLTAQKKPLIENYFFWNILYI